MKRAAENKWLKSNFMPKIANLAEEMLAEIPDQLTNYMIWRGFQPDPSMIGAKPEK